jgi:hypothetical protein
MRSSVDSALAQCVAHEVALLHQTAALTFGGPNMLQGNSARMSNDVFQQSAAVIREWQPGTVLYTLQGPRMAARALRLRQQLEHMGIVRGHFMTRDRVRAG